MTRTKRAGTPWGNPLARGNPFAWTVFGVLAVALVLAARQAPAGGLVNAGILIVAAAVAAYVLLPAAGAYAPLLVATFVFASALPALVHAPRFDALGVLAVVLGLALLFGARRLPGRPVLDQIYRGEAGRLFARSGFRLLLVGALLTVPALVHPECGLLLLGAVAAVPRSHRRTGAATLLLGATVTVASGFALGLLPGDVAALPGAAVFEPALLVRNLLLVWAGRHTGVLVVFLPLVLGPVLYERGSGRFALLAAAGAALVLGALLRPFDFVHVEAAAAPAAGLLLHRPFAALYPVFWFLGTKPARPPALLVVAISSLVLLLPLLPRLWPSAAVAGPARGAGALVERWRRYLPAETSQAGVWPSGAADRREHGLVVRRQDAGAADPLQARLGEPVHLLVGAPGPLEALVIVVANESAPGELALERGRLTQLLFRPDGGVGFELEPGQPVARHPTPWAAEATFYELAFTLPAATALAGETLVPLVVRPGRLLERRGGGP